MGGETSDNKTSGTYALFYTSYVAVRLLSKRSKMASKYDENIKVAHGPLNECVIDARTTF